MTGEDEEHYRNNIVCRFSAKNSETDDHCHLTGKYRGPDHNNCNINVTKKQNKFFSFVLQNFSNYDVHLFLKKIVDKKND